MAKEEVQDIIISKDDVNIGGLVETKLCVYYKGQPVTDAKVTLIGATRQSYNTDKDGCIDTSTVKSNNSEMRYIIEKTGYEIAAGNIKNNGLITVNLEKKRFASVPVVMGIMFGLFTVWRIFRSIVSKREGG